MPNNKLPKFCVFCGKKPSKKTKEHIIPKWLIKLTGNPKREIVLGINTQLLRKQNIFENRKFSFQSFQFPACNDCNNRYSDLEAIVKPIVEKILNHEYLNNNEINNLLDWFDKVRTGLWLGSLLLDSEIAPVNPKFFINQRIASKDRGLIIYELNDSWKGVQFVGFNSPGFQFSPSCISLTINNFVFTNFSYEFVLAKELGFPYPKSSAFLKDDARIESEMKNGSEKIGKKPIKMPYRKPSIEIYQPIYSKKLGEYENNNLYDSEFVKNNSIDSKNGIGAIFYREHNSIIRLENDFELLLSDPDNKYDRSKYENVFAKHVMDLQTYLLKKIPSTKNLDKESKNNIEKTIKTVLELQRKFTTLIKL